MCLTCHQEGPSGNYPTPVQLADEIHQDGIVACIRGMAMADGSVVNYCVDCGVVVEGTNHNCYD